jgi:hypothetical protein
VSGQLNVSAVVRREASFFFSGFGEVMENESFVS